MHHICKRDVELSICVTKKIIILFSQFSRVLDIPLGRRFRVLVHLLKFANWNHGSNFIQSDGIIFAGSGNMLCSMLNQISTQLEVLLSLLRHSMTLINIDKICMMTTRFACNRAIESSYWRMDNNSDVGLLMGYVLYRLPIELESMDLDTFSR
jgi:hypothetical protein